MVEAEVLGEVAELEEAEVEADEPEDEDLELLAVWDPEVGSEKGNELVVVTEPVGMMLAKNGKHNK